MCAPIPARVEAADLEAIRRENDALNLELAQSAIALRSYPAQLQAFEQKVDRFLASLQAVAAAVTCSDDYDWLRETASKWKLAFASVFGITKDVPLSPPEHPRPAYRQPRWSDSDVEAWLRKRAFELCKERVFQQRHGYPVEHVIRMVPYSAEGDAADWSEAERLFACEVLEGNVDFVTMIGPESYWRLEQRPFRDAKRVKAYFIWLEGSGGFSRDGGKSHYMQASEYFEQRLFSSEIKFGPADFEPVLSYVASMSGSGREEMLQRKAQIIPGSCGIEAAALFAADFYDQIIPAVMDRDVNAARRVVSALRIGDKSPDADQLINCFEMAIAIYFLDPALIEQGLR